MIAKCPQCNTPIQPDSVYCDICGANLVELMMATTTPYVPPPPGTAECVMCGYGNPPRTMICEYCGSQLIYPPVSASIPAPSAPAAPDDHAQPESPAPPIENQSGSPELFAEPPALEGEPSPPVLIPELEATSIPQHTPAQAPVLPPLPETPAPPPAPQTASSPGYFLVQPDGETITIPSGSSEVTIGREDVVSNIYPDIDLNSYGALNRGVGRKHIQLTFQGTQATIIDLNSVNGSHLNGQRLSPNQPVALNDGDELILGRLKLIFRYGGTAY